MNTIEQHLNSRVSFELIGGDLSKNPTTIDNKVKNHTYLKSLVDIEYLLMTVLAVASVLRQIYAVRLALVWK